MSKRKSLATQRNAKRLKKERQQECQNFLIGSQAALSTLALTVAAFTDPTHIVDHAVNEAGRLALTTVASFALADLCVNVVPDSYDYANESIHKGLTWAADTAMGCVNKPALAQEEAAPAKRKRRTELDLLN